MAMASAHTTLPPQTPSFDDLPRHIATSFILPYVTSSDWLSFRVSSRRCYETVHGNSAAEDVTQFVCPTCRIRGAFSTPTTTTRCDNAATNTIIRASSSGDNVLSENLWKLALVRDFMFEDVDDHDDELLMHQSLHSPVEPVSDAFVSTQNMFTASNLFVSWMHWRKLHLRFNLPGDEQIISGPYFVRAGSMWQKIEQWCNDESRSSTLGRTIKSSLLPGIRIKVSLDDGDSSGCLAFQAVNAFYAGQCDENSPNFVLYSGLFGAYHVYTTTSDTRWCEPPSEISGRTRHLVQIARADVKDIYLELSSGQVYSRPRINRRSFQYSDIFVATPCQGGINRMTSRSGQRTLERPIDSADGKDSILRWFEEHANRLHHDYCTIGTLLPDELHYYSNITSLLKYPSVADTTRCSRAVTRGIEIIASAVFIEEFKPRAMFVYSIRMRLLTPDDGEEYMTPEQRGFRMCQLVSRQWMISKKATNLVEPTVQEVRGDGVVGYYPILVEGGYVSYYSDDEGMVCLGDFPGCFKYQSCTEADEPGSMEGFLQFSPGNMISPTGPAFNVRVAPFPLEYPQFLY